LNLNPSHLVLLQDLDALLDDVVDAGRVALRLLQLGRGNPNGLVRRHRPTSHVEHLDRQSIIIVVVVSIIIIIIIISSSSSSSSSSVVVILIRVIIVTLLSSS
jgi:hypothetical protein